MNKHIPAILETWFSGTQGGNGVADVLFGDYNPSGKLPVSFPYAVGQIPVYYNHKNTGRPEVPDDYFCSRYLDIPNEPVVFVDGLRLPETSVTFQFTVVPGTTLP